MPYWNEDRERRGEGGGWSAEERVAIKRQRGGRLL